MAANLISQGLALCVMAVALGMDAFSVCVGMGMTVFRLRRAAWTGLWIGIFHMVMPLIGMTLGQMLSSQFGEIAEMAGGILLLLLGIQMIFSQKPKDPAHPAYTSEVGLMLFALSVSIDSFSVGLGMGLFGAKMMAAVLLFGVISMGMAWGGFYIGRTTGRYIGRYGELLGGLILFVIGLRLLFHMHI